MKKIGIFLGFGPEQPIKNQGIGRLLAFILSGILERNDTKVVIATPGWHQDIIHEFLVDQRLDITQIELISTSGIPCLLRIKRFFSSFLRARKKPHAHLSHPPLLRKVRRALDYAKLRVLKLIFTWLSFSSPWLFVGVGGLLLCLTVLFSPLILMGLLALALRRLAPYLQQKIGPRLVGCMPQVVVTFFMRPTSALKNYYLAHVAYDVLRTLEMRKLIKKLNQRKDIPVWFVPSLFWPEIAALQTKKVVAAPDVVFVDFPSQFVDLQHYYQFTYQNMTKTIASADHFICYSEYVKQKHLVEAFYIAPSDISVIHHGVIDLNPLLPPAEVPRVAALRLLQRYQHNALQTNGYLRDYDLSHMQYLFYSSQIRPHKNFLHLVKAYEILLRKRFLNIKLVVTADFYKVPEVKEYVLSKRLQYDILSLPDVSSEVLAALNQLAVCAVNPSLFEGGFPFTFAEAYSVGTPSVMGRIPVTVAEINDANLQEKMLFDPYHLQDMVNKIEWAVKHRDALYALQQPLYERFKHRTWNLVAKEYIDLLNQFTETPKP